MGTFNEWMQRRAERINAQQNHWNPEGLGNKPGGITVIDGDRVAVYGSYMVELDPEPAEQVARYRELVRLRWRQPWRRK